jgi:hypothetical protein
MRFFEKLDCLMNITKTTNSALSQHLSLDSSHVSRLRRGERRLVPNAEYIDKMATYFIRQCSETYQKRLLSEVIKISVDFFNDPEKVVQKVKVWLLEDEKSEADQVSRFVNGLNSLPWESLNVPQNRTVSNRAFGSKSDVALYYGAEGKREAVIGFLSSVLDEKKPGEILLYSDESMDWMTQDLAFQSKWAMLMYEAIKKGNRLKVIHTVSRNLDEMLEALSKWIPLYITGAIEPYYYPRKRDGIFKRTMFIAPQKAALCSSSMDGMTTDAVNILFHDAKAIDSYADEFNGYLSLCKPLMRIYTESERQHFIQTFDEFESEKENAILKINHLSLVTMPEHVVVSILDRLGINTKSYIFDYYLMRREKFLANLKNKTYREIISIVDNAKIKEGSVEIGYTGIKELAGITYHAEEYKDHLKNILNLLSKYDNYNLVINRSAARDNYRLYAKEDLGVIVEKITEPYVVFAINEANMTAAFWDYLNSEFGKVTRNKQRVINELNGIVDMI